MEEQHNEAHNDFVYLEKLKKTEIEAMKENEDNKPNSLAKVV